MLGGSVGMVQTGDMPLASSIKNAGGGRSSTSDDDSRPQLR